jgi:hypothetical protein
VRSTIVEATRTVGPPCICLERDAVKPALGRTNSLIWLNHLPFFRDLRETGTGGTLSQYLSSVGRPAESGTWLQLCWVTLVFWYRATCKLLQSLQGFWGDFCLYFQGGLPFWTARRLDKLHRNFCTHIPSPEDHKVHGNRYVNLKFPIQPSS